MVELSGDMSSNSSDLQDSAQLQSGKDTSTEKDEQPDGGLSAWVQVLGCFILYLNTWGLINSYGVFQSYYQTKLLPNRSPDDISWIGSLQVCLLFLGGMLTGPAFDMGYLKPLLMVGSTFACLGLFLTSICTKYWQIMLAQGLMMGIGNGCLFLPAIAVLSQYFTARKGLAFGIASLGGSVGGIVFPIMFQHLQRSIGFPWATRSIAFIMLATFVVPVVSMKTKAENHPSRVRFVDFAAYKKPSLSSYVMGIFFGFCSIYIAQYYIQIYAANVTNISSNLSFYLLPILNATSILGRLISNYLADKIGFLNVQIPNTIGAAILCLCWIAIKDSGGILAFAALYGFFTGSFVSLPGMTIVSLSPDLSKVGLQLGVSFIAASIGVLVGPPTAGAILKVSEEWLGLQIFCGVLLLLFGAFTLWSRLLVTGMVLRAKA